MRKKITGLALGALLFVLCFPAEAQQPQRVFRIGYLSSTDRAGDHRGYGRRCARLVTSKDKTSLLSTATLTTSSIASLGLRPI